MSSKPLAVRKLVSGSSSVKDITKNTGDEFSSSPRIFMPKRENVTLELDRAVMSSLADFEKYLQEENNLDSPVQNGIVEVALLKTFREHPAFQAWLKEQGRRRAEEEKAAAAKTDQPANKVDSELSDEEKTALDNLGKTNGSKSSVTLGAGVGTSTAGA